MKSINISKQLYDALDNGCGASSVKAKLNAGASPNYKQNNHSLLELAIDLNHVTAIKHLLATGARIGGNELCRAVHNILIFKLLLDKGADINAKSIDGSTALHAATKYSDALSEKAEVEWNEILIKRIETLLSLGANPMISNKDGLLPLNLALLGGNETLLDFLLPITNTRRKDIDHQNNDGQTLLMRSVLDNDLSRVKDLVARGASLCILDKDLHTALSLAIKHGYNDIALFLHKKGCSYKKSLKLDNEEKMLYAVRHGYLGNVYEAILRGETPPAIAAIAKYKYQYTRFFPLLKNYGASYIGVEKLIETLNDNDFKELCSLLLSHFVNVGLGIGWRFHMRQVEKALDLITIIKEQYPDDDWMKDHSESFGDDHSSALDDINYAGPAWKLRILSVPSNMADRRKSMLSGPLFTSEEFPWPEICPGKYASPIVQIDLKSVTDLTGKPFGDGMLQVWFLDTFDQLIRIIPRAIVENAHMTPVAPHTADELNSYLEPFWLSDGKAKGKVDHVIGYEGPVFSGHVDSEGAYKDSPPEVIQLASLLNGLNLNDSGTHMFGTFYPVQYRASQMGGDVFMTLGADCGYTWGDEGTAQIFYKLTESGPVFSFHWSCY